MFNFKKAIVIGCPGAGKSFFSKKLHYSTGIELFHLDAMYWTSESTHTSRDELVFKQKEIFKMDSFIIDGHFKGTLELRIREADIVFFFDLPTEVCIDGVRKRKNSRPELPFRLPDDDKLIEFIKSFNKEVKPRTLELFEKYHKKVITFHSHKEADNYIEKLNSVDLTLNTTKGIFNHRVAAVIMHNNKILAQKNDKDNSYYLIGGRVQFGESSEEAVVREIREELNINIIDYKPIWINECFFMITEMNFTKLVYTTLLT